MYLATVRCARMMPSLSNSPWIRGAPHRGLARLISRMRVIVFGAMVFRPALEGRLFHFQKMRKPSLCQWMTVPGLTRYSRVFHPSQVCESQAHRARSIGVRRGRLEPRLRTSNWWRRARFSRSKFRWDFSPAKARRSATLSQRIMRQRIPGELPEAQCFRTG